jgi:N-acetylglutamate synthase-like GNAT family acetyltransferase
MSLQEEANISIRNARKRDIDNIKELIIRSKLNPTSLDWRNFLIAESFEGDFVGCGQIKSHADGSKELASLAVREPYRGQGIGKSLIEVLISQNPETLHLMCQSSMGSLYEIYDFEIIETNEMPTYFRRVSQLPGVLGNLAKQGESLLIMRRAEL